MATFSPSDAALEGFRLTRERPRDVLVWWGFSLLVNIVMSIYMISIGAEARDALEASSQQQTPDLGALTTMVQASWPLLVVGLLVQCVMAAAVYRVLLRPEDRGFGHLKLSMDEVRLVVLTLIYVALASFGLAALVLVAGLVVAFAQVLGTQLAFLVGVATELFCLGLLVFVAVRLSLAPAITFAEQRLAVFASWNLTRGYFWRLLGAYVLALVCVIVVAVLATLIFTLVSAAAVGGDFEQLAKLKAPDQTSFATYFSPLMIAYLIYASALSALYYVVVISPAAVAYRALARGET